MSNAHERFVVEAAQQAGVKRITCPRCNGGPTNERLTMAVFDVGGKCYRASCAAWIQTGTRGLDMRDEYVADILGHPYVEPYNPDTTFPPEGSFWFDKLATDAGTYDVDGVWRWCAQYGFAVEVDTDTLVTTCRGWDGKITGYQIRTPSKNIKTHKAGDGPVYYSLGVLTYSTRLVVVEDARSAACVQSACPGVAVLALLGTGLQDRVLEATCYKNTVLVALDPGAEDSAARVARRFRDAGASANAVPMSLDPKDCSAAYLKAVFA